VRADLLGRLHVSQRGDDAAGIVERHSGDDDDRARRPRLECGRDGGALAMSTQKKLNVGIVGYGFMGRTHSNAFGQVTRFFPGGYEPVLKAACARDAGKAGAFASQWGYESMETDWRKLVERKDIDLI